MAADAGQERRQMFSPRAISAQEAVAADLDDIFERLYRQFGDLGWWPADSSEEMAMGAILVQNVSWSNTVKAIASLEANDLLSFSAILAADEADIERCIVPTRYYRMKTKRLKAFARMLHETYHGQIDRLLAENGDRLRSILLAVKGIGPETADAIALYGAGEPSFVVDAYTKRIFHRLGFTASDIPYEHMRAWFMCTLPRDANLFNHFHALVDRLGNSVCLPKPRCGSCPLENVCQHADNREGDLHSGSSVAQDLYGVRDLSGG